MLVPIALHAAPPARPAPPVIADTTFRDSSLAQVEGLARAVVDTFEARGVKAPTGLFVLSMGAGGVGAQLNVHGGNVPDALRASVGPIATAYINRRGTDAPLALTIRLERVERPAGPRPAEGPEERPQLRNGGKIREYMGRIIRAYPAMQRGMHHAVVDMQVNREGRVAIVHIREWAGAEDINPYLAALANELEYTPARIAGQPVTTWIRQTFSFGVQP